MTRAWRLFGVTLVLSTYFLTAPIGYGLFWIWASLPTRDPIGRAHLFQDIMWTAFRSMHAVLRWMRILDFDPRRVAGDIPKTPCVLVANHPTLTDISALLATERHLVFPVKPALFESFWARPLLAGADHFPGAAPGAFAPQGVIEAAVDRLERGYRLIIFPEGTRSPECGLHPFGRTAFEVAVRAGVPIVPIVITCEPRWLARGHGFFADVDHVPRLRLRALPPVHPTAAGSSSRRLRDIVSDRIRSELGQPRRSDVLDADRGDGRDAGRSTDRDAARSAGRKVDLIDAAARRT